MPKINVYDSSSHDIHYWYCKHKAVQMLIQNIKSGSWWQYYMCTTHLGKTQFAYPSVAALFPWKFVELCPFLQLISPPYPSDPCLSGVGEHTEPLPSSGQWDGWLYYHYHHLMEQKSFFTSQIE